MLEIMLPCQLTQTGQFTMLVVPLYMTSVVTVLLKQHLLTASIDATLGKRQVRTVLSSRRLRVNVIPTQNHFGELHVQVGANQIPL